MIIGIARFHAIILGPLETPRFSETLPARTIMSFSPLTDEMCVLCGEHPAALPKDKATLCPECYEKSEALFDEEMRKVELIRTIRGIDVELYDVKHPNSTAEKNHCGQVIIMRAGQGFEVKICLRSDAVDWMTRLADHEMSFESQDTRLDALIGNVMLLIESWGGGPHYMDILYVDKVVSTEGEI
jgi:hypothetical protein